MLGVDPIPIRHAIRFHANRIRKSVFLNGTRANLQESINSSAFMRTYRSGTPESHTFQKETSGAIAAMSGFDY